MLRRTNHKTAAKAPRRSGSGTVIEHLVQLRQFCPQVPEAHLADCLKQSGYNVNRAAEALLTGQYVPPPVAAPKAAMLDMTAVAVASTTMMPAAPVVRTPTESKTLVGTTPTIAQQNCNVPLPLPGSFTTDPVVPVVSTVKKPPPPVATSAAGTMPAAVPCVSLQRHYKEAPEHITTISPVPTNAWLLCQRWLSDACCLQKQARTQYQEPLHVSCLNAHTPSVRLRGARVECKLPEAIAKLLVPLDRWLHISARCLMTDHNLPIGAHVPVAVSVYIADTAQFFALFSAAPQDATAAAYFANLKDSGGGKAKTKRRLPATEAAFELLQWAQYGNVPDFTLLEKATTDESDASKDDDEEQVIVELADDELDNEGEISNLGHELEQQVTVTADHWMQALPEAPPPPGLADGLTLRGYQKQALHWMWQREQDFSSQIAMDEQLQLLSELNKNHHRQQEQSTPPGQEQVACECGPVLLSATAQFAAPTLDGRVNVPDHPLWQRRYLASSALDRTMVFFVNELLGVASHVPPEPPRPCSGGILGDAMGLGKTVMLLALMLRSKAFRESHGEASPKATLVVAKLSLLHQWEVELKSKTSLSYRIYYGGATSVAPADLEGVDVVVTTYGTVQAEAKRTHPVLLQCQWLRVILDEAHCIKNVQTVVSRVCCQLPSQHRWCVSGTIIQNSLDDVYGILKFLHHEPWCMSGFWKSAITKPMNASRDNGTMLLDSNAASVQLALDRVRRVLRPLMLRRTKDSLTKDGQPILTLPPIETKVVPVVLSDSEREFYNAVLARSQEVFEGFVKAGTAQRSYIQILALLQRLRQACDHIALTVRNRVAENDLVVVPETDIVIAADPQSPNKIVAPAVGLGEQFIQDLLNKFAAQHSPRKRRPGEEYNDSSSPTKRTKDSAYLHLVATSLSQAVADESDEVQQECPICLENLKLDDAVITPCGHVFCKPCLIGTMRRNLDPPSNQIQAMQIPDGPCPCCNSPIQSKRVIALKRTSAGDSKTITTSFLTEKPKSVDATADKTPTAAAAAAAAAALSSKNTKPSIEDLQKTLHPTQGLAARQILEKAINSAESSKLTAILHELRAIWQFEPGSKVLVFSQYLGFLDMLGAAFGRQSIPYYRLDGSLTLKERMEVLDQFSSVSVTSAIASPARRRNPTEHESDDDDGKNNTGMVLLMSMSAGAEGLNLTAARTVFVVDPWWNVAKEDQCVHRVHRLGQTAPLVRVRKFVVQDSVEERMIELQIRKAGVAHQVYNDGSGAHGHGTGNHDARLTLEEFKLIFRK